MTRQQTHRGPGLQIWLSVRQPKLAGRLRPSHSGGRSSQLHLCRVSWLHSLVWWRIRLSSLWLFVRGGLLGVGPAEYYARRGHIDQSLARAGVGMSGATRPVWTCTGGADSAGFSGVESLGALE